ncbi:hypothetical protein BCR34DRAFT_583092 [Clohesyomyces aquaticus]|uniref:BTB domain-containing protein n=1 Tax=Clohesyomyces aquaticus TaxID=1231657 RepID=A0A1Y2A758_9PLEO|nr:hypothetical protein BCR34DRAFT_583092 [Clohesyomyces aquaticus]
MFGLTRTPPSMQKAWDNGEYSDLKVTCGSDVYDLHKVIVCHASSFFKGACRFPGKESQNSHVDILDEDPCMVHRMLSYIYLSDYEPSTIWQMPYLSQNLDSRGLKSYSTTMHCLYGREFGFINSGCACMTPSSDPSIEQTTFRPKWVPRNKELVPMSSDGGAQVANPLLIHASMYALADRYGIPTLSEMAKGKFFDSLRDHWDSEDFVEAVAYIYSSTPDSDRGLRDTVIAAFKQYMGFNVEDVPGIEDKLHQFDTLTFMVLKEWGKRDRQRTG